ncbi:hypothetical protein ACLHDG_08910 [Sulfurovum sp. CS9]|uniref:hypothetical protein n=1 Tax=Sulfurovum sp. CS9 TaxID=3391146 RepID=UPI0039EAE985
MKKGSSKQYLSLATAVCLATIPVVADNLTRAAQNPISSLISLPMQFTFDNGAENGDANILNVQPVYPITSGDWNYVSRMIIPLVDAPGAVPGLPGIPSSEPGPRSTGLGDINYSLFLSPVEVGSFIWGGGVSMAMPTASKDTLGSGKFSIGPTAVILKQTDWGSVGVLGRQIWSVAGDSDRKDVSQALVEPFISYNLEGGWYLSSDMIWIANWKADSGNQWTIPLGGGFGRIFKIGDQSVNSKLEAYTNVVKPDGAPDWNLRFVFQFLFPK